MVRAKSTRPAPVKKKAAAQKVIILYLLGLFAAIDLACIVGGFCGTDKFPIEVRHLQRIAFPQTDSIQPLKNNISNDTIR